MPDSQSDFNSTFLQTTSGASDAKRQKKIEKLIQRFPAISDLQKRALKRLPFVGQEYLEAGTTGDVALKRNRSSLDAVTFLPKFMKGSYDFNLQTELLGKTYGAPFGMAPVGLDGIMWPKAEIYIADACRRYQIPYCLSTAATRTPEELAPVIGDMGWFQLYPPNILSIRKDVLKRAKDTGFHTLVITVDIPQPSRRERSMRAGLRMPPSISPYFVWQALNNPVWTIETLKAGLPRLKTIESYSERKDLASVAEFAHLNFWSNPDWAYIEDTMKEWDGPVIVKGILHPEDAERLVSIGVDAVYVSNHGARQLDATPGAIEALPAIVERVNNRVPVIFDSGIRSGLDILKAYALGADFVMCGRAFMYGVCALGNIGPDLVAEILIQDLQVNMAQLGVQNMQEVKKILPGLLANTHS